MAKPLVIVESPAKARTIGEFLGDDYVVESSVGHVRDLPSSAAEVPEKLKGTPAGKLGVDVENHFEPVYVIPANKKKVVAALRKALKGADELYLATDEDREGEAISWHVQEVLNPKVPVKRMVFHEITPHAIEEAIEHGRELDMKLVEAQEGRRVLDRLVGWDLFDVLRRKVGPGLSAGRVQSVATRLVVERERARMAFRSGEYWDLMAVFTAEGAPFDARLLEVDGRRLAVGRDFDADTGRLADDAEVLHLDGSGAAALRERLGSAEFSVRSVESKPYTSNPKPPFITSTIQQEAGRKLGFSASRTMAVAQRLYERGYITYMRTDSVNLSSQAVSAARTQIRERYGAEYLPDKPRSYSRKVKNAQEAHEAIRPSGETFRLPDDVAGELDTDERRVYDLVWKRTIACQMAAARGHDLSVRVAGTSTADETCTFAASGRTIEFPGFLRAYVEGADDPDAQLEDRESPLPPLSEGQAVDCDELEPTSHITKPPARYTEASLVKELEERGIGRPSTYASVIGTIQNRGYVWKKGSALVPAWVAFAVVQLLERHFSHLVDYGFTARMEEDLDVIARGEGESEKWLHQFYFGNGQAGLRDLVSDEHLEEIDPREVNCVHLYHDPVDGELEAVVRVGRYGPYLDRDGDTASLPDDVPPDELTPEAVEERLARAKEGGRIVGKDPESGLEIIAKDGRFGPFLQLGELVEGEDKPKTASLFASMSLESVDLETALALLSLPRVVGQDSEGREITAQNGRYGAYLKRADGESRSLDSEEQIFTVTVAEAEALYAQPKRRGKTRKALAELGEHPDNGKPVKILEGRFGPYATDGITNASIPRGRTPEEITLNEAVEMLRDRLAKGPTKKKTKKKAKRKPAKKKAKKKPAKKKAKKKPAKKKAPAKRKAPATKKP
ncbi:MAG: type I DNA topoisomerase [Acidimicrobiia bacterium]|nr:type I DNA topoisomerase [Acidimicrobiia bacterium]